MNTLLAVIIGLLTAYLAYTLYARRIDRHVIQSDPKRATPATLAKLQFSTLRPFLRSPLNILWLALFVALCGGCQPNLKATPGPPGPQPIHGYVFAVIRSELAGVAVGVNQGGGVAVPDIVVAAKNINTGILSSLTHTDPYGYFRTPPLTAGTYNICVSGTGYEGGCDPQVITIAGQVHIMDHIVMIHTKQHAVTGSVVLADKKTPCFWYNPMFDANFTMTAKVTLIDSGGLVVTGPIRSNNLGQYIMPTEAAPGSYKVAVECEATHAGNAVSLTAGSTALNFTLKNNVPTADLLEARKAGVGVRRASPGDGLTITVPSADVDQDTLHYKWVDESGGTPSFPDAATVNWSAPALTGPHTLRVLVSDGHGGYAVGHTLLNVGPNEMRFNGTVFNRATNAPVAAAAVNLDGVTTTTDAAGRFEVKVPETTRFVLNVSKPGFALTSRMFYARATGIRVPLDPVQTSPIDGATGGTVNIKVVGCKPREHIPGKPNIAPNANECPKEDIGTLTFTFGPNSLVSGSTPFTGTATIEGFQFDLTLPNAIPGDLSAKFKGADVRLQTFGAFHSQPRDAAGSPLQMAPGKSVDVSMPIHPLALASAPANIPFFSYEESSGFWVEHGELTRVGNNYVGKITHFSEFNADTTSGSSSCMKIQLDQGPSGFPQSVILNASYVNGAVGNFNHPNTVVNDTVNPIVIERLVPNQDFHLQISDANNVILQTVLLNSGSPVAVPFPVPYPYDGCKPAVVFNNSSIPPTSNHFLITGTITDTSADYKTKTTTGNYANRDTFAQWLSANGFGGGASESKAIYFNNGDLQFGRSMHCRNVAHAGSAFAQDWIACYVSNFGSVGVDFNQQASNPLTDAYANTKVVATVAMEYHPDQTDKVQFWAFKGDGSYFPNPALDAEGNKPMPQICMGCHQGSYAGTGSLVNGAVFLPFDVDSFIGDDGSPIQNTLGGGGQRPTQSDFRQLNQFALQSSNKGGGVSDAYQRLMDIWYKDGGHPTGVNDANAIFQFNAGAVALNANTPGIFATHQTLYDNVVRPACRTCHVARDPTSDTWDALQQLTSTGTLIQLYVCGPGNASPHHFMPHAQVPYKRFWQLNLETILGSELGFSCVP
jgi:hypothetical protein